MNAPKLRFKRYTNNWKHKLMSEVVAINPKVGSLPERFIYIDLDSVNSGVLVTKKIIEKKNAPSRAQRLLSDQDILIQTVRPYQKNHLLFKTLEMESVASTGYAQLKTKVEIDPEFIYQLFYTGRINEEINKRCTGTSYPAISAKDLETLYISIPSYDEQVRISVFLKTIDKKIQLQQEKIDLLKEQKKGYMQKIFSQELRFKDDNHQFFIDWKEVELGNISVTFSGGTPSVSNRSYYNGTIPFIRSGEIHTDKTELYISETAIKRSSAKMVEKGDILYALYGATSGEVAISQIDGAINQAILCIRTNENKFFLKYWLENMKENILNVYLQGGQGNLSASIIKSLKINLPHIDEQAIIAEFFVKIDKKIQREEIKLNFLMQQKHSFIQQMFI